MPNLQTRASERVSRWSADSMWTKNIFLVNRFSTCSKQPEDRKMKAKTAPGRPIFLRKSALRGVFIC